MTEQTGSAVLDDFIGRLELGEAQVHENVTLFPVCAPDPLEDGYMLLKDALDTGRFTVGEIGEGGHVPELSVVNDLDADVLLLDGEQLIGAKQNRIVNTTIIIGKGRKVVIPVSCVEQGRWQYRSRHFQASDSHLYADLRRMKSASVSRSLQERRSYRSDQGEVWASISEKMMSFKTDSSTMAMEDIYAARESDLRAFEDSFRPVEGQVGFIVLIGGRVVGGDIFGVKSLFDKSFQKLLRGYLLDGLEKKRRPSKVGAPTEMQGDLARTFLSGIVASRKSAFPSVGEGADLRIEGNAINGFGLVRDDNVIHVAAFAG